jgi:hypothetical protein
VNIVQQFLPIFSNVLGIIEAIAVKLGKGARYDNTMKGMKAAQLKDLVCCKYFFMISNRVYEHKMWEHTSPSGFAETVLPTRPISRVFKWWGLRFESKFCSVDSDRLLDVMVCMLPMMLFFE